ncbi:hypothetical protein phiA034_gene0081 [Aeromonas phage phiA034]|uniref:Uncharacterized protein n=1 Tax=Aeromonas phage phiA034 TaxID=2985287 RepID=A0AAE9YHW7_9CAUD|nr:hypothetical protein phiA034_gene0081 [Aeromonas phage phiA034]
MGVRFSLVPGIRTGIVDPSMRTFLAPPMKVEIICM